MGKLVKYAAGVPAYIVKDRVVQRLSEAEKALAHAVRIDQVKLVMGVSAAQEVFAKRQKLGEDVIGFAHTIKVRALVRLGELLQALPKATGGKRPKGSKGAKGRISGTGSVPLINAATLADLGVSKKVASVAQQLAALPAATREAIAQRETTITKAQRAAKAEAIQKRVSLPDAKYRVLYADPPWSYGNTQPGYYTEQRDHYPVMPLQDICDLPVKALVGENAVLFLWVTSPMLFESADVVKAWGFKYKASFVWDKMKHNMGHYNSVRHEFLLVCVRGSCQPDTAKLFDSVVSEERTAHGVKPTQFYEIIETLYPHGKRLELFARGDCRPGWDVYGFEAQHEAVS